MEIYLGYETALAHLRTIDAIDPRLLVPYGASTKRALNIKEALDAMPLETKEGGIPHVLVPDTKMRQPTDCLRFHLWRPKTHQPCFFQYRNGVFVSTPEALFIQLSRKGRAVDLLKLSFELCGTYAMDERNDAGFRNRPALTSVERLRDFALSIGLGDKSRAVKILRFARDGSASPMETKLALMLGLPPSKGGYGLGMPQMNHEVRAPKQLNKRLSHTVYHCDLFWPESRVALEYDSSTFHANAQALTSDSKRKNDLEAMGITVFTVTSKQVVTPKEMDRLSQKLAGAMKKRLRPRCKDPEIRKLELRRLLFMEESWDQSR